MSLPIMGYQRMAYNRSLSIQAAMLARQARTFNPFLTHISQYKDSKKPEDLGSKIETFLTQVRSLRLNPSSTCISPSNERKKPEDPNSSGSKIEPFFAQMKSLRPDHSPTYISQHNECKEPDVVSSGSKMATFLAQRKTLGSYVSQRAFCPTPYALFGNGLSLKREISTSTEAANVSEVSIAAADSSFPIAAVQHFIDGVHCVTGLNWWASIVVATLLFRGATFPIYIYCVRINRSMFRRNIPQMVRILNELQALPLDKGPEAMAELKRKMNVLLKDSVDPIVQVLLQLYFFAVFSLAISNMAEKVPSFKTGGMLWFTDLSTPDAMCILPALLTLAFLIPSEVLLKIKGINHAGSVEKCLRASPLIWIPLTMSFSKALFFYWITTNLLTGCFKALSAHINKKALGEPTHLKKNKSS